MGVVRGEHSAVYSHTLQHPFTKAANCIQRNSTIHFAVDREVERCAQCNFAIHSTIFAIHNCHS